MVKIPVNAVMDILSATGQRLESLELASRGCDGSVPPLMEAIMRNCPNLMSGSFAVRNNLPGWELAQLLQACQKLHSLRIYSYPLPGPHSTHGVGMDCTLSDLMNTLTSFHKLRHLEFPDGWQFSVELLQRFIIELAPKLRTLVVTTCWTRDDHRGDQEGFASRFEYRNEVVNHSRRTHHALAKYSYSSITPPSSGDRSKHFEEAHRVLLDHLKPIASIPFARVEKPFSNFPF
jgi:hypothetical protein